MTFDKFQGRRDSSQRQGAGMGDRRRNRLRTGRGPPRGGTGTGRNRAVYRWETVKKDRQGDSNRMVEVGQQAAPREINLVREALVRECSLNGTSMFLTFSLQFGMLTSADLAASPGPNRKIIYSCLRCHQLRTLHRQKLSSASLYGEAHNAVAQPIKSYQLPFVLRLPGMDA